MAIRSPIDPTPFCGLCSLALVASLSLGCGPGGFASGAEGFGDGTGSGDATGGDDASSTASSTTDPASSSATNTDSGPGTDTDSGPGTNTDSDPGTDTDTDTDSATDTDTDPSTESDSWTDPDESDEGELPSPGVLACARGWTHIDTVDTHGHIGNTPIAAPPTGGLLSVNPIIGEGGDPVNVDAWMRGWSSEGLLEWEELVSWAANRDDIQAIDFDELGNIFVGGRLNANQGTEDAMIARLSSQGQPEWIVHTDQRGGFPALLYNGAVVLAAGELDVFTLMALDPDTGEELWFAEPEGLPPQTRVFGMEMIEGSIYLLVEAGQFGPGQILRVDPPGQSAELLTTLDEATSLNDFARFGSQRLAALYFAGGATLGVVDRSSGELELELDFGVLEGSLGIGELAPEALIETASGLAVAGDVTNDDGVTGTFLIQFDEQLEILCVGAVFESELEGVHHDMDLRGLSLGSEGEVYTGTYVPSPRLSVFVRWD